ncbi:MAG TPA: Maf family nucleotide pyrophosphatase [Accumulibacter sp.]|uniref:Maf family protein n=1 Tax=Accumulibacter sp. TaxID=2053492 RepID=UPI00263980C3|nr:Maf family nucleotide pyrophosphatase [Accumulibacter sp.]MDS4055788.1 Maf family nucleotide pyrophosphatase [Accumulibacter sp.]HMV05690.1 Maf family nucleotide pyrophosphatase [Accumulibacter sp.]HMW62253.1 Maf family nucleotide pyrophosphatase [Accumulibacter sp.]HMW79324.1 Maf family nucleotide pyrophosphatase [Accumulibacter sp.]HMX68683.1 Maf family nucleotide pyrophosphatase [Accumulibacter sp.]
MPTRPIVLASSSPYRRELLGRLGLPFVIANPAIDETPLADEAPAATALRLAEAKARAVTGDHPTALIIGSDQVACLAGRVFGKPGTHQAAVEQLRALRGRSVSFITALCLLDAPTGRAQTRSVTTLVTFRALSDDEIARYLQREQAYNCAGSAKSEGLGIALLERIEGDDPNALIGLPLIALCELLRNERVSIL